jgi:hypothetical protein
MVTPMLVRIATVLFIGSVASARAGFVFDTELIVLAAKRGVPVKRVPVKWTSNRPKRSNLKWLKIGVTMMKDLIMLKLSDAHPP